MPGYNCRSNVASLSIILFGFHTDYSLFFSAVKMRFVIFSAVVAAILGSSNETTFICHITPDTPKDPFPCTLGLEDFMVEESVNRLTSPDRKTVTLPSFMGSSRMSTSLLEWRNLNPDQFVEWALPVLDVALRKAIRRYKVQSTVLMELVASFECEEGEEARRSYCLSFHNALQQVPESAWSEALPKYRLRK